MKNIVKNAKLFIGLGLAVLALGCGTAKTPNTNSPANAAKPSTPAQTPIVNAPTGAQPPNLLGSPTANVTVEEFADFQCPTCATIHAVMKNVQAAYGSRIKFIYRHFPLTQIHKNAYDASVAAESAGQQGKFWDMQNLIFTNQQSWSNASDARIVFEGYAEKLGLDVEKFKMDVAGLVTKERVNKDMERGRALNISSTPTIFVNGISVPFEQLKLESLRQIIDAELQKAPQTVPQKPASTPANTSKAANSANSAKNAK